MGKCKIISMRHEWGEYFRGSDIAVPEEVPVLLENDEDMTLGSVINAFIRKLNHPEDQEYFSKYKEFVLSLVYNYTDSLVQNGSIEEGISALKTFSRKYPDNELLQTKISQYYFEAGFPREAGKYICRSLKISPESPQNLTYAGVICAANGNIKRAEKLWLKAVTIQKDFRKAWLNLINLYNYQSNFSRNKMILSQNPDLINYPEIANQLGISLASLNDYQSAISLFEKARKESEIEIPYLEFNLAQAYMDGQRWKDALDLYQEIYRRSKNDQTRKSIEERINFINNRIKNPESAKPVKAGPQFSFTQIAKEEEFYLQIMKSIDQMKKEAAENPDNPWVYYNLGNLYAQLGKYNEAIDQFRHSLKLYEENALIWHTVGLIYLELGNVEEALASIQRSVICRPHHEIEEVYQKMNFNMSLPYFNLGDIYLSKKKYQEAIIAFQKGLEVDARSFLAHYRLGFLFQKLKEFQKAEESFRKSLMLNDSYPPAFLGLAQSMISLEKIEEAVPFLKRILIIAPDSEEARASAKILKKYG